MSKKSILEILETDSDAAHKLRLLAKYEGWRMLVEILTLNEINPLADRLRNHEYSSIEERNREKDKLDNLEMLLNAPSLYIAALDKKEEPRINPDPYASDIEEARRIAQNEDL